MSAMKHLYTLAQELVTAETILDELQQAKADAPKVFGNRPSTVLEIKIQKEIDRIVAIEAELAEFPREARLQAILMVNA